MQVLHLVDANDEIFARDYVYQRPQQAKPQAAMPFLDNADGFFDGLPRISSRGKHGHGQLRLTKAQKDAMQLQLLEQRQAAIANKISALRDRAGPAGGAAAAQSQNENPGSRSGPDAGEEAEEEKDEQADSSRPNIIGNAEEIEAEQSEMNGSGPNQASPFVQMQSQEPRGLSSAVHAARQRQANARRGAANRVSDFSAARKGFQNMKI